MDKKNIKLLENIKERRIKELAQNLLQDEHLDNARENIEWLRLYDQLASKLTTSDSPRLFWPVGIGAFCLLVVGIAWTQHIQSTQISFEVISPNVSLKLSEDWTLNKNIVTQRVYIKNLDKVLAPELDINFQRNSSDDEESATLELKGHDIRLKNKFTIPKSVLLDLTFKQNRLTLEPKGKSINGRLEFKKAEFKLAMEHGQITRALGPGDWEIIDFTTSESVAEPNKIEISISEKSWAIRDFRTTELRFEEEYPPASGQFESAVKSGKVRLLETGAIEELREGDNFKLEGVVTRRLELSKNESGIKVYFEGEVSAISAGPAGYETNLAPTYLDYIYHNEKLALLWSAIVFLWGFLWSLKNTLFRK